MSKISDQLKARIDAWIKTKGCNEYGDPPDTMYAGGSPLFDERTGQMKDRYEYILSKNPELAENED
ncbi:MAG: hypothetical protein HUU35_02355 [Armatimonadetes bacterium]|nr:hypothetical protein [Armatimonadota bacterium]